MLEDEVCTLKWNEKDFFIAIGIEHADGTYRFLARMEGKRSFVIGDAHKKLKSYMEILIGPIAKTVSKCLIYESTLQCRGDE